MEILTALITNTDPTTGIKEWCKTHLMSNVSLQGLLVLGYRWSATQLPSCAAFLGCRTGHIVEDVPLERIVWLIKSGDRNQEE